ncbi:amidohydrolase [Angelakisella massiliensis]|uniref:amidohydrolase n=1 Tax=Angelakisella massiliensis TaxID=1871018 RepID=UPI0024B173F7|nr:amidohydrolase [Angelakisella massiliensis]
MVIKNVRIITCQDSQVVEQGYVEVKEGKITAVGQGEYTGNDPEVLDGQGGFLTPGFIDAHCHLGMWEEGLAFEGDDGNEETDPCTPQLRSLDAINPRDRAFGEALSYGITTVVTGPGSANPIAGQICAMKTWGNVIDDMVVRFPCAMKFALGENPKNTYSDKSQQPVTRMAIASIIREQLYKARRYQQDLERSQEDEDTDPPDYDIKCEALLPVLRRQIKAHVHAHRADDICTALRLFREFDLDGVIIHGTEGYLVADAIRKAGVPVVCGPIITTRGKPELANACRENPMLLMEAGVPVSINTDANELPIDMLLTSAAIAAGAGSRPLPWEKALEMVTIRSAEAAGISDRVGSIAPGKDADLCLFRQPPVGLLVRPEWVMIDGKFTHQSSNPL